MIYCDCLRRIACWGIFLAAPMAILLGCQPDQQPADTKVTKTAPPPLRLLVIGDSGMAKVIKREWEARSEGELTLQEMSADELLKNQDRRIAADAIVYPSTLLGDLATRDWLTPVPKDNLDDPGYQYRDIFAATRKQEMVWEEDTYAVPLGSPQLLLFYRRDILDELSLKPPQTWAEYRIVSERLMNRANVQKFLSGGEAEWYGVVEPLADLWAAQTLLARAAAYGKHRSQFSALFDYRSMTPLIAGPPFVRALEELSQASPTASRISFECSPADAVHRLRQGQCAMAIGWLADGIDLADGTNSQTSANPPLAIEVSPLPGSQDVYNFRSEGWEQRSSDENYHVPLIGISGRLGSITKECRQPVETIRLLMWLSGPEMGAQISAASQATAPFRLAHIAQIDKWTSAWRSRNLLSQVTVQQYATAIEQSLAETDGLIALRIPGRDQYLKSLADAVRKSIEGEVAAETVLAEVAQHWRQLTDSLGTEKQRLAYARSIGLRP